MPHIIVEYSANIEREMEIAALFAKLAETAVDTGVFPLSGTRVRGAPRTRYHIADGHVDNAFVHTVLKVGHGRSEEALRAAGERIFAVLCAHLGPLQATRALNISMEIQEIHPVLTFKNNNTPEFLEQRSAERSGQAAE